MSKALIIAFIALLISSLVVTVSAASILMRFRVYGVVKPPKAPAVKTLAVSMNLTSGQSKSVSKSGWLYMPKAGKVTFVVDDSKAKDLKTYTAAIKVVLGGGNEWTGVLTPQHKTASLTISKAGNYSVIYSVTAVAGSVSKATPYELIITAEVS